jgi:hypothetical protein
MWIDAVCINQQNLAERADQVKKMKNIYQMASKVTVWLGQQYINSEKAF